MDVDSNRVTSNSAILNLLAVDKGPQVEIVVFLD